MRYETDGLCVLSKPGFAQGVELIAVGLDHYYLYSNPKGAVAGLELIFKPPYVQIFLLSL